MGRPKIISFDSEKVNGIVVKPGKWCQYETDDV